MRSGSLHVSICKSDVKIEVPAGKEWMSLEFLRQQKARCKLWLLKIVWRGCFDNPIRTRARTGWVRRKLKLDLQAIK